MTAPDGKMRLTDVANTEQLLRIMQSVPSPKAEPIRAWLAEVGRERIEETIDPEQAIDRALETYLKRAMTRTGFTKGSFLSVSAMNSPTNGRSAELKRDGNLRS